MVYIYPYKTGRKAVRYFRENMGWRSIKLVGSRYKYKRGDVIINWGSSIIRVLHPSNRLLNNQLSVYTACNKLSCFTMLQQKDIQTVEWTTDRSRAILWRLAGETVYARSVLNGHGGAGITIVKPDSVMPHVPLYTKGLGKCREYRVHVFGGKAKHVTQKLRRNNNHDEGWIKNHANGWIFGVPTTPLSEENRHLAEAAVTALGLDFGAVDIATKQGVGYVLEVNTAPGLEGQTLGLYCHELNELVKARL